MKEIVVEGSNLDALKFILRTDPHIVAVIEDDEGQFQLVAH